MEILTVPEVLALAGEEIAWSVQGILPVGGVGILSGSPGLGKSWLALDLAVEIARGGSWLGQFPCRNDRVLLIDEESAEPLMRLRLGKILAGKGISGDGLNLFFAIGGGFNFSDGEALERFRVAFRRFQPGVVIFDSLIRLHRADENDARQMAAVFGTLKELVRGFNLTVLLIDHHRKPQGFGDSLQQLRGSSEKAAFVDTALTMNRKDKRLVVEHSKSRYAEAVESFIVTITDSAPGQTVVAYGGSAEAAAAEEALASARGFILKALQGGEEVSRQSILEKGKEKGVTKKAIDLALAALEEEGSVVREDRIPEGKTKGRAAFFALQKSLSQSAPYIGGTGKVNERGASGE
ncbi:MAG: AAA family ATPase [Planctomycetes bacterium]|nr:AAA family ATPase [Planctomycetota bacterium]